MFHTARPTERPVIRPETLTAIAQILTDPEIAATVSTARRMVQASIHITRELLKAGLFIHTLVSKPRGRHRKGRGRHTK